ncbi:MAG: hypothetical protein JWN71_614 [Xanthobacteraceae bacterium]|jgi:hypothetical protein|nr:hypothetical protein [Xanthobacteraceae bacterium]
MHLNRFGLMLFAGALTASTAHANDSTAQLATGGLIFVQNEDIEMRSEDLFISTQQVRVRYRFYNKAAKPLTFLVAFPMPEIRIEHQDQNISVPTEDPENILGFETKADGKPVATKVEQRVFATGLDRTQYLKGLGIPLAPHLASTNQALDKLPRDKWDDLIRIGLAEIEEYGTTEKMEKHLSARWGLQTTYYWDQTFPAQAEIVVEHQYTPSVGGSVGTMLGAPGQEKEPWFAAYKTKYCIDKDLLSSIDRAKKAAKTESTPFSEERVDYILRTGANWSGPIKEFRLVVDKGSPDSLISFCGDGVKKIGPTQFEMRKTDFSPDGNLSVLILKRMPKS